MSPEIEAQLQQERLDDQHDRAALARWKIGDVAGVPAVQQSVEAAASTADEPIGEVVVHEGPYWPGPPTEAGRQALAESRAQLNQIRITLGEKPKVKRTLKGDSKVAVRATPPPRPSSTELHS